MKTWWGDDDFNVIATVDVVIVGDGDHDATVACYFYCCCTLIMLKENYLLIASSFLFFCVFYIFLYFVWKQTKRSVVVE